MTALLRAAHIGPAAAVVVLATLLAIAMGLDPSRVALVAAAVATGQLTIGWSNDLIDEPRDRLAQRADKPLVTGEISRRAVAAACGAALVGTGVLSFACGWWAGVAHLCCVAAGWAYNLGVKATVWSWLPYAVSFGGLVVFVALAGPDAAPPPAWLPLVAALLGVGAHLLNALPDLRDDELTGVQGLPHRLGPRWIAPVAAAILATATVVAVIGAGPSPPVAALTLLATAGLAGLVLAGRGPVPFAAAVAIAGVDVLMLLAAS